MNNLNNSYRYALNGKKPYCYTDNKDMDLSVIYTHFKENSPELLNQPLNDSLLRVIVDSCRNNSHAINISNYLSMLQDPYPSLPEQDALAFKNVIKNGRIYASNRWKIPAHILDQIGEALESGNTVLVLSANNDRIDLSTSFEPVFCRTARKNAYFKDFADHPKISSRLIIAGNIEETFQTGQEFILEENSNYPGKDTSLQAAFVCAPGTDILLPKRGHKLDSFTGTSFSAPYICGIISLMQSQHYAKYTNYLPADEIVQQIRLKTLKYGDPEIYGQGIINVTSLFKE